MVRQWIRAATARVGIRLPFRGVICVHGTQSVSIDLQGRADIKFRRWLVFLEQPSAGDLRDVYAVVLDGEDVDPQATDEARKQARQARLERGLPYDEFVASWRRDAPPEGIEYHGSWEWS